MNSFLFSLCFLVGCFFTAALPSAWAEESKTKLEDLRLDTITVTAESSFDSLSEESYIPVQKIKIDQTRSGTLDSLTKREIYPSLNYGYPAGANGVNLGGRTIDDTQVFTLGVPLNLPQGGGADFSFFPAFLWSEVILSPTISSAGFSPSAAAGSIQLKPWTREMIRDSSPNPLMSRLTVAYDRNLQTYSLATRADRMAALIGVGTGLQTGPAGSFSYYLLRKPKNHLLFHLIGSNQDGDSPGSRSFPTPNSKKKTWRVIPVLESHQQINSEWAVESTLYGDLQGLQFMDPGFSSDTRTQQYGLENAILYGPYTLALSARYTRFFSSSIGDLHEWPILSSITREIAFDSQWTMRLNGGVNSIQAVGTHPLGRATLRNQVDAQRAWFYELNTIPKLPTLSARYYVLGTYHGNPDLKPERVNAALFGHEYVSRVLENSVTVKGEYRSDIQVNQNNTTQNVGHAYLTSLKNDFKWKPLGYLEMNASTLLTYSQIKNRNEPYPDLPYFSQLVGGKFSAGDRWDANAVGRYVGNSRTPDTTTFTSPAPFVRHPDYFLFDAWVNFRLNPEVIVTAGIDNLFNNRAEVVFDYPLPGRVVYLSAQARF